MKDYNFSALLTTIKVWIHIFNLLYVIKSNFVETWKKKPRIMVFPAISPNCLLVVLLEVPIIGNTIHPTAWLVMKVWPSRPYIDLWIFIRIPVFLLSWSSGLELYIYFFFKKLSIIFYFKCFNALLPQTLKCSKDKEIGICFNLIYKVIL